MCKIGQIFSIEQPYLLVWKHGQNTLDSPTRRVSIGSSECYGSHESILTPKIRQLIPKVQPLGCPDNNLIDWHRIQCYPSVLHYRSKNCDFCCTRNQTFCLSKPCSDILVKEYREINQPFQHSQNNQFDWNLIQVRKFYVHNRNVMRKVSVDTLFTRESTAAIS